MVSRGLAELDVQELVVTVGGGEGTTFREAVTANGSSNSPEFKVILVGHGRGGCLCLTISLPSLTYSNPGKEVTALRIAL